ncbi:hypothetical protein [Helicobacter cinaedi]|uniref:hypothetical protein n=1 Tax=Helicobacter cinaedi TaxID=213 RepID=UPI000D7BDD0A|nr:hypothetical protein [Helicobacter cinaedi]
MSSYYIQIFIEEAGTPLNNGDKSRAGHMWFKIYALDEDSNIIEEKNAGYTSNGIVNDDNITYQREKAACESQALEITQETYEKLKEFADKTNNYAQSLGFGNNDYNFMWNSCVDYVWKALEIAGYNERQFEGKLVPMKNCKTIQTIVPHTKSTIFNRDDLFYNFNSILYPNSFFLFDFNISKNNENISQVNPLLLFPHSPQETILPPNTINSHRKGEIQFQIQALDEYTRMPIANAKLQLQNVNLGQEAISDTQGLTTFEIDSEQNLKSFRAKLIHKDYQEYPILDRSIILNSIKRREKPLELRFKQKLDNFAVQQVKLEPNEYILTDANNEIITKNFYKVGDTLTLKASFDENKVKENEIKWVYKAMKPDEIQMFHQQDSKDKNPYSTQLHPVELDEIPKDTLQILQDSKTFFSNTPAYTIKNIKSNEAEPENIYKGKTLEITIPQGFENKQIAIFAYKNEPNWKVCQIIRINDYPQITIDCTLAETLRANARNDEISRLGWGVSYICQRLWHDNPANAKELGELIYIDSRQEDFIDSIPNETMKEIVKEILPRIEMREFAREIANQCPKVKSQIQQNDKNNLRFYVELDWDKFYMQFPLMKGLEDKILKVPAFGNDINQFVKDSIKEMTYESFEYVRRATGTPKILHNNFFDSAFYEKIIEWLKSDSIQKDLQDIVSSKNTNAKIVVMLDNIYQGFTKNEKIFSLKGNDWKVIMSAKSNFLLI